MSRVNISLDTLNLEKFSRMTRGGDLNQVLRGIEAAHRVGFAPLKINTVLVGGFNDDEIPELVELTRKYPIEVRFIELMPLGPGADFGRRSPSCRALWCWNGCRSFGRWSAAPV